MTICFQSYDSEHRQLSPQLWIYRSVIIVVVRISNVARFFIYESSMPKDMTCARMRKYIELRDKL